MTDNLTDVERLMLQIEGSIPRLLFVVAGPSGVGKNTIIRELLTNHPYEMARLITYTTRPRRDDEVEGQQYHFVTPDQFEALARQGRLLEVDEESIGHDVYKLGHVYSMPRDIYEAMPREKHILIAEVDIYGMRLLRQHYPECVTIFVTAPPQTLMERILERPDEHMDDENLAHRMKTAEEQIAAAREFDYIVFNEEGRLCKAVTTIEAIVRAERMRVRNNLDLRAAISPLDFQIPSSEA
jgi:guanylate kinase